MRRRSAPEAIGLSVLDLVCGLFGLLVVLYATTARVDGSPGVAALPLKFVRIQLEGTHTAPVGLEITVGGQSFQSWPACADAGPVTWASCEAGVVEALVESTDPIDSVRFLLLEPPTASGALYLGNVNVWATTPEAGRLCNLQFASAYRGDLAEVSQCVEP